MVNNMHTAWFRELCCYAENDILQKLHLPIKEGKDVIEQLLKSNILRRVKKSSNSNDEVLPEDMDEIFTDDDRYWTFTLVGILMLDDIVIRCYPKYMKTISEAKLPTAFNQILSAIRKYEKTREQHVMLASGSRAVTDAIPFLSVVIEVIEQYQQEGFYQKQETIEEINGMGDIDWEKTVHEIQALLSNGRPFYPDMYTKQSLWDELNFFYCLHQSIVSECFDIIDKAGLMDFLGLHGRFRSDIQRHVLGSEDYLLRRIEQEMPRQFITSKRKKLQLMQLFLTRQGKRRKEKLLFYGTNAMNLVWETACSAVVGDQLQVKVRNIPELASDQMKFFADRGKTLLQLIDQPEWIAEGFGTGEKKDTLIPDCIRIRKSADGSLSFSIYDAKYYNIVLTPNKVSGQPGIESVTKQYLYHLAYGNLLETFEITDVKNTFLFPSENGSQWLGWISMPMMKAVTGTDIRALLLDAAMVFQCYLDDEEIPVEDVTYHGHTYESPAS